MIERGRWLISGLFFTTLATLLLELLDSRLLSVLTWYHLSFFAVSLAMLGTAAGAVYVFLRGARSSGEQARTSMVKLSLAFAVTVPLTHLVLVRLRIPPMSTFSLAEALPLAQAILMLTIPYFLSGAVVTLALTRCGGRIGLLYGADLIGASMGCLLIVPLLHHSDIISAAAVAAVFAAIGAFCFIRFAGRGRGLLAGGLAALFLLGAVIHVGCGSPIDVAYTRGVAVNQQKVQFSHWNAYSHVMIMEPKEGLPFFWGRGEAGHLPKTTTALMLIDGTAGTPLTQWDGDLESIAWVGYDITSLPYQLRRGDVAIIGVGGGRDVLSAIWGGNSSITGIELNETFVDLLSGSHRQFANIAGRDNVRLINDEARSYLSRTTATYDILQMSLVDTWASTGAGAYTLTENGLYTVEAWKVFLSRLKPNGLFSTSRWFHPNNVSETSRLLSLCVTALLEHGVEKPSEHIALLSRDSVATLLTSISPFSEEDVARIREIADQRQFDLLVIPDSRPAKPQLARIINSTSMQDLEAAVIDPFYDFRAPTDERPYFFNMLKPQSLVRLSELPQIKELQGHGGVLWGNIRATITLFYLLLAATILVVSIIFFPLLRSGLPQMRPLTFAYSLAYFAMIGYGFMSIQIPFLQRFSVFIGHPIYTYSMILFAMILFAGVGSLLSERISLQQRSWLTLLPVLTSVLLVILTLTLQTILDAAMDWAMMPRCLLVIAINAPVSLLLGFFFPMGMRLVSPISERATPWMWGINGACGVLASILAVAMSMWAGIHVNLAVAALLYLLLTVPANGLARLSVRSAPDGSDATRPEFSAGE